jgi:NADPH2:quinone reductase
MKAIQVSQTGGPEALVLVELPAPQPKANEALVQIKAAGVNFIDVYFREGRYPAQLPFVNGQEAAGVVTEIGSDVTEIQPGDRVAYTGALGSYAEYAVVPAARLVKIPDDLSFEQAAAAMLQGMTAHYLLHSTYKLRAGETALIHAAAGGVGLLLVQMAKKIGARVIGTAGTPAKAQLARDAGADDCIVYTEADFETETRRLTDVRKRS